MPEINAKVIKNFFGNIWRDKTVGGKTESKAPRGQLIRNTGRELIDLTEKPYSWDQAIGYLTLIRDWDRECMRIKVTGEVTSNNLRSLVGLPFMVDISDKDGEVYVTSGRVGEGPSQQYEGDSRLSKLSISTVPVNGAHVCTSPTFGQLNSYDANYYANNRTPQIAYAVLPGGIAQYALPYNDSNFPGFETALNNWFDTEHNGHYPDDPVESARSYQRFCDQYNCVIADATWDGNEKELLALVSRMNQDIAALRNPAN